MRTPTRSMTSGWFRLVWKAEISQNLGGRMQARNNCKRYGFGKQYIKQIKLNRNRGPRTGQNNTVKHRSKQVTRIKSDARQIMTKLNVYTYAHQTKQAEVHCGK